jgi:MFS family permease
MAYAILLVSALLVDIAFNMPMGSLPLTLASGGVPIGAIALIIGAGPIASLLASVPIGGLTDRFGRLPTIRIAAVVCALAMIGLSFVTDPWLNGAIMALRGIAATAYVTAEFAYASTLVAPERAVSATATLGMVGNLSFATAPALGYWLWQHGIAREQYAWAGAFALVGALILLKLPREHRRVRRSRKIFMRSAWLPAITYLVACTLQSGVNGALAVLTFHNRGISNGALLFTAMAATTFGLRYFAGRMVDRFGPRIVAIPTAIMQAVGALLAARAHTPAEVVLAGMCLGVAWSAVVPVGIGLFFERSSKGTRGAAMGSYNLAFSFGATGGALLASVSATLGGGYTAAMTVCAFSSLLALPWVLMSRYARPLRRSVIPAAGREAAGFGE